MNSPFINDPYSIVWEGFQRLYPDKKCECWLDVAPDGWKEGDGYGFTVFHDDGSPPSVVIYGDFSVLQQIEIFAHELAHVAVGPEHDHDEVWFSAFELIFQQYNIIGEEIMGGDAE